ncbi:hypothetical protein ACFS07_10280 [Undibacterium arcticum]
MMNLCGNEAPLAWLANSRGYELKLLKSEAERRVEVEHNARMKAEDENRLLRSLLMSKSA